MSFSSRRSAKTSFELGRQAEAIAAEYLAAGGYRILQRNWRTRYCEIDLVIQKNQVVFFVEVKYRSKPAQGSGLDYITPSKLRQMTFAAELWISRHRWTGNYRLAAISASSWPIKIEQMVEL